MDAATANRHHMHATAINSVIFAMYASPSKRQVVTDADAAAVELITDTLCAIAISDVAGSSVTSQDLDATKGTMNPAVVAAAEAMKAEMAAEQRIAATEALKPVQRDAGSVDHAHDLDAANITDEMLAAAARAA
jgi:hypothetical protein